MKISLIINTYNWPKLLENCLTSLYSQSDSPDEIIIADDGSKEDLLSVSHTFKNEFKIPIKYVTQADKGFRLARSRNNGAKVASGDFLFYLDQDLIFTENFVKTIKNSIKENHFLVGWPIKTTQEQLKKINIEKIRNFDFYNIFKKEHIEKIKKQYRKDYFYRIMHKLKLRKCGSKFRGGVAGFFKKDFVKINGYDEKYIGWGNEDDDFGRRLYYSGIKGINPFKNDFPIHLWHQEFHNNGTRINMEYHNKKNLSKNNFRCNYGYNNPLGTDKYKVIEI